MDVRQPRFKMIIFRSNLNNLGACTRIVIFASSQKYRKNEVFSAE